MKRDIGRIMTAGFCGLAAILCMGNAAIAQPIFWTTLAGNTGGPGFSDGTGAAARFQYPTGMDEDSAGNLYVADSTNHTIRKITPAGVVTTLAGSPLLAGTTDGTGSAARFSSPAGIATDANGNVFVADSANQTIRKITPAGLVTTLAGTVGQSGTVDGSLATARLNYPRHLVADLSGSLYVAEYAAIRKVHPDGGVTTLAGGSLAGRDNGAGTIARFNNPCGITRDASGNLFVVDHFNHSIRRISTDLMVTTFAGGFAESGSVNGVGISARFSNPAAGTADSAGNLFISDYANYIVRKITPTAGVSTFAGTAGSSGSTNGTGSAARFGTPAGAVCGPGGIVYVADQSNHTIRKITSAGQVTTFAGSPGLSGSANGTTAARFNRPQGLAIDTSGNVYVADYGNHIIRKITSTGSVTTLAGTADNSGSTNGNGAAARFNFPHGIAVDASGNVYVSDWGNHTIRKITSTGDVTTLAGTALTSGSADGTGAAARMNRPCGLTVDSKGNLYLADRFNHTIRKLTSTGVMKTVGGFAAENGLISDGVGSAARFNFPTAVWVDAADNLYVADSMNERIVKGVPALPEIAIWQSSGTELSSGGTINYGILAIGSTTTKTLTIRNTGKDSLTLTSVSVAGGSTGDFTVNTSGMRTSIPTGELTTFSVSFTPSVAANSSSTLRLLSNDSDEATFNIDLSGMGNTPPDMDGYSASTAFETPASLSIAKMLRKATDADGDAVALTSAGPFSLNGGSASINSGSVVYTPPVGFSGEDSFAITLTDTRGAAVVGTVTLSVAAAVTAGQGSSAVNPPQLNIMPGGAIGIRFHGIPGRNYKIERSNNLTDWQTLATARADATGEVSYSDPTPPQPSAYYRLALP